MVSGVHISELVVTLCLLHNVTLLSCFKPLIASGLHLQLVGGGG